MIHFDSSFLIDLLRERRREKVGPAHHLLMELAGDEAGGVSLHAVCELYVGIALTSDPEGEMERVERLLSTLAIAMPDETFPSTYARILTGLRRRGASIATMDLLIATSAVCAAAPLVTRNPKHFRRVPGLEVIEY